MAPDFAKMLACSGRSACTATPPVDRASFRLIAAQMYVTCGAKQANIARALGVPQITIERAVKQYRADGIKGQEIDS